MKSKSSKSNNPMNSDADDYSEPPKLPLKLLKFFLKKDYLEEIEGDMEEVFKDNLEQYSEKKARRKYLQDTLKLLRLSLLKNLSGTHKLNQYGMFKNHIKISLRYLQHHKTFAFINLTGLTIGILICFFAMVYVDFETSYDAYHEQSENIYRLVTDIKTPTGVKRESSSIPMAPAILEAFPVVNEYARVFLDYMIVQSNPDTFMKEDLAYADASVFSLFTFPLLSGNIEKVLDSPYDAVLSESAAIKYFGTIDCIGKELTLDGSTKVYVTGIMKDMSLNSHFRVDILLSLSLLTDVWNPRRKTIWKQMGTYTYLILDENTDVLELNNSITELVNTNIEIKNTEFEMSLEPLQSIYLHGAARGSRTGVSAVGNIDYIYILVVIVLFILFTAAFNFINLSTALSLNRAKEISIRKVLGVVKRDLVLQFLLDAILFALVAFVIAVILFFFLSPYFNLLVGKQISTNIFNHIHHIGWLFGITLFIGLVAGLYPAFFLSNIDLKNGLKGRFVSSAKGMTITKALVVIQFAISIILITSTLEVYEQLNFMQNQDLGYNREQKLILDFYFDREIRKDKEFIKQELMTIPGVNAASMASGVPGKKSRRFTTNILGKNDEVHKLRTEGYLIDYDFMEQYEIEIMAGRAFDKNLKSDLESAIILNEAAVKELGYADAKDIIGKPFTQGKRWKGTVVGVVKDFHFQSMRNEIKPLVLLAHDGMFTFITLNIAYQNFYETITALKEKWSEFGAKRPFSYHFADQAYQAQYEAENRFGKLVLIFAGVAIFISSLGLLGLAAFKTTQRSKEIGIRKILGASSSSLFNLLTKDFMMLLTLAFILGIPISILGLNAWLANFAYHISLDFWVFILAGIIIFGVSMFTIGSQVLKAAIANPVDSLRDE